ncbi:hypothetical protein MSAN_01964500 [Mycena sanguinolenta]|uniref:DUF6533 domain-containing protein n=1 Tax=Mycena sanguinolenta TaxID=230812 RepID=A0A8H6XLG6_9AGAR|nr:hypothetical protein MSAN_01964500 [Mycena sanguinolenta]
MSTIDVPTRLALNANYYLDLISFSLLCYEYFITLELEVSRYWGLRPTVPNVLFFVNRYGMLFGTIPIVFQSFWTSPSTPHKLAWTRCESLHFYHQWFAVVSQIVIGVMLILRTYALYERNRRVLALMVFVSLGVIAVGAWAIIGGPNPKPGDEVPQLHLYIGCSTGLTSAACVSSPLPAWAGNGFFDCTIFLLTLYRALSRSRARSTELVTVLLRDGSIYFGVIILVNLSNILTFVLAGPYARGAPTTLANSVSSVMITRLMLNLRDPSLFSMAGRFSTSATLTGEAMFSTYLDPNVAGGLGTTNHVDTNPDDIELQERLYP